MSDKAATILLVDDEPNVTQALLRLLRHEPYEIVSAISAHQAQQILERQPVDVVVSDEQMPGMKGHELQRHLRAHGHGMPIIFITAFPEKCGYDRNEQSGMIALLEKPFDGGTLVNYLRDAVAAGCRATGRC